MQIKTRDNRLMVQAATWEINPGITRTDLAQEEADDPWFFWMEYGAQFADVVDAWLPGSVIEPCHNPSIVFDHTKEHIVALDPGLKHSRYGMVAGYEEDGIVVLDMVQSWKGTPENPVKISEVEAFVLDLHTKTRIRKVVVDQHQSAGTIERLIEAGLTTEETVFTSTYNMDIYGMLKKLISQHQVMFNSEELREELKFLQCKYAGSHFKVEASVGKHDDLADAAANCVFQLVKKEPGVEVFFG